MTDADYPSDGVVYRHAPTDDEVRYIGRENGTYRFRVNGQRSMDLQTENWPTYRQFLEVERHE